MLRDTPIGAHIKLECCSASSSFRIFLGFVYQNFVDVESITFGSSGHCLADVLQLGREFCPPLLTALAKRISHVPVIESATFPSSHSFWDWTAVGELSNLNLLVHGTSFPVCSAILSVRCSYFAAVFRGPWTDATREHHLELPTVSSALFSIVWHALLTGRLPPPSHALLASTESGWCRSTDEYQRLLHCAEALGIPSLVEAVEEELLRLQLSVDNVCQLWNMMRDCEGMESLQEACCRLVQQHFLYLASQPRLRTEFFRLNLAQMLAVCAPGEVDAETGAALAVCDEWCKMNSNGPEGHLALRERLFPPRCFLTRSCKLDVLQPVELP